MSILCGLGRFAEIMLVALAATSAHATYNFPNQDDRAAEAFVSASVRIFDSEKGEEQIGSGFVIDGAQGLILSALHVISAIQDGHAWVAFRDDKNRHKAKIVFPKSSHDNNRRDLSILQLDPPVSGVRAFEVQFDKIEEGLDHRINGYGRRNPRPLQGKGLPSKTDECTYTLRSITLDGDSGSAIVTPQGLVDGIVTDGAESQGTSSFSEMKVLSLHCVRDAILGAVSDGRSKQIFEIIRKGDDAALASAFKPPPVDTALWVSNLRLAKAISQWVALDRMQRKLDKDRTDTIIEIIADRHLGWDMVKNFCWSIAANEKEAGDILQHFADTALQTGKIADATSAYGAAKQLYVRYAMKTLTPQSQDALAVVVPNNSSIALAYKAAADVMLNVAKITGTKNGLDEAAAFASAAILSAPSGKLRASSWATLGAASYENGNFDVAVPAYKTAVSEGASKSWIYKDLSAARAALGTSPQIELSAQYLGDKANSLAGTIYEPDGQR
ncbi:MAG TPA: serine protease [Xanthobacteraceae bacterium]|jgi:tetratricopeptide (TPR) repeat protein